MLFRLYRNIISPVLHAWGGAGSGCRFEPTCSNYFETAVARYGWILGGWLGIKRVCSCHPLSSGGYDPVPEFLRKVRHGS